MKEQINYLDTSILIAALDEMNPHSKICGLIISRANKKNTFISQHSLAEFYNVLSARRFSAYFTHAEILAIIDDLTRNISLVSMDGDDYLTIITSAARNGIRGGAVYDAIHMYAAQKAQADNIYTLNEKDFIRVMPELAGKVRQP